VSDYDDGIWEQVPDEPAEAPEHLLGFVRALGPARRALDLGCGDGRLTREIRADAVLGADASALAVERARARVDGAEFVQVEPDQPLPFEDSSFDLVVCVETIEHVRDVQLFLSEARRVLEPRGELALTTPAYGRASALRILVRGFEESFDPFSPHLRFLSRRSLERLLDGMGFDVGSIERRQATLLARATR
jgi:SAM-dependent methyltransferase